MRERAAQFEAEAAQKRAAELYIEAREAVRVRDDFLTVAAHELRTPLTTLRLEVQRLARSGGPAGPAHSVERLCKLVDQLLDVSRLSGGLVALHFETGDLRALVQETAAHFAERSGCDLRLVAEAPVEAEFDPLRIEQVVAKIAVRSKPGEGATFTVEFPLARKRDHLGAELH